MARTTKKTATTAPEVETEEAATPVTEEPQAAAQDGGEATPATGDTAPAEEKSETPVEAETIAQEEAAAPVAEANPIAAVVICHERAGRRRGGRRFAHGRTDLTEEEISDDLIEALKGDPDFTVEVPDLTPDA